MAKIIDELRLFNTTKLLGLCFVSLN